MTTLQEKIAVMQAFADGKAIECSPFGPADWAPVSSPAWNWDEYDYRVKREPREFVVIKHPNGILELKVEGVTASITRRQGRMAEQQQGLSCYEEIHVREVID